MEFKEINKTMVLNLTDVLSENPEATIVHAITKADASTREYPLPMGLPVMVRKSDLELPVSVEEGLWPSVSFAVAFPPVRSNTMLGKQTVAVAHLSSISYLRPLPEILKTIETDRLDEDRLPKLRDYIKDIGAITFLLSGSKKEKSLKFIENFSRRHNHSYEYHKNFNSNDDTFVVSDEKEEIVSIISFFNLPYIIPIFDTRKVDGVGVQIESVLRKASIEQGRKYILDSHSLIFSQYKENVIYVDGTVVNDLPAVGDKTQFTLLKAFGRKVMTKATLSKKRKQEGGESKAKQTYKAPEPDQYIQYTVDTSISTNSTSTGWATTSYYYKSS